MEAVWLPRREVDPCDGFRAEIRRRDDDQLAPGVLLVENEVQQPPGILAWFGGVRHEHTFPAEPPVAVDLVLGFTGGAVVLTQAREVLAVASAEIPEAVVLAYERVGQTGEFGRLIAFSPSGEHIASCGGPNASPIVVIVTGKDLSYSHEFNPQRGPTRKLLYSPKGEFEVVVNKWVHLLSAKSRMVRLALTHPKQVYAVTFDADGPRLQSACHDHQVRLWNVASGELLHGCDWQ